MARPAATPQIDHAGPSQQTARYSDLTMLDDGRGSRRHGRDSAGATVGRDLSGAAGSVVVAGTVNGDILAAAGELTIEGSVGGAVDANLGRLRIGSGAVVEGDVLYASEREAEIAEGAQLGGDGRLARASRPRPPHASADGPSLVAGAIRKRPRAGARSRSPRRPSSCCDPTGRGRPSVCWPAGIA